MALVTLKQNTPAHRAYVIGAWIIAAAALIYVPWFAGEQFRISQFSEVVCFAVAILGLNMVIGFSGQLSLGHSAFVGIGAYTAVILVEDYGWNWFLTIPVAMLICFAVGMALGLPALRIKGLYLAVVTLALAVVFPTIVLKYDSITGGANGKRASDQLEPPGWTPFDANDRFDRAAYLYFVVLIIAVIMFILARNLMKSRTGRAVIAIRDNQTSAATSGVPVPIYKTLIFGMSAIWAGVGGAMFAIEKPFVNDTQFGLALAIFLIVGLVAGGVGTISGAIPGALLVVFVPYYSSEWSTEVPWLKDRPGSEAIAGVIFGVVLIIFVFLLPGGVVDGLRRIRARIVRVVPNPPWLGDVQQKELLAGVTEETVDEEDLDALSSTPQPTTLQGGAS
jgi:branched-chain amino acid transport system permease protein